MDILITGAAGFVGTNLASYLQTIQDGRNRMRMQLPIHNIYMCTRDTTLEQLDAWCAQADFVFHLAGVNRPQDPEDFLRVHRGFSLQLLQALKRHHNTCPVMLASSLQATLSGRFGNSQYGISKNAAEQLFFQHAEDTGAPVLVYRFPNIAGKWCKPEYNSAVATFCHHIAHDLPIHVDDRDTAIELLFIDDLIDEMCHALTGHPHRCDYPAPGEERDGTRYDGLTPHPCPNGPYCYAPVTYHTTLGAIADLLSDFRSLQGTSFIPALPSDSLAKKLFSMYLSYLPKEKMCYPLHMHVDHRGIFTEILKTHSHGQVSINIARPGIRRGEHWHSTKWEIFMVVSGHGLIQQRKVGTEEVIEFEVRGEDMRAVILLPGYTHNIINLESDRDLVTVMLANEQFQEDHPDTFYEPVEVK